MIFSLWDYGWGSISRLEWAPASLKKIFKMVCAYRKCYFLGLVVLFNLSILVLKIHLIFNLLAPNRHNVLLQSSFITKYDAHGYTEIASGFFSFFSLNSVWSCSIFIHEKHNISLQFQSLSNEVSSSIFLLHI